MRPSAETLLMLLIVALFIQDSLLLLRPDEGVLVRGVRSRWRAGFGTRSWRLAGNEPYICNPFTPHAPVFRLRWQMTGTSRRTESAPRTPDGVGAADVAVLRWLLCVLVWTTWCELFVLVPLALTGTVSVLSPTEVAFLLYFNIALSIVVTWVWRRPLGLSGKVFAQMAFECLVCAPYAANLVRRIGFAQHVDEDFLEAAERLLSKEQLRYARRECLVRINEQIEVEVGDGGSASTSEEAVSSRLEQLRIASARLTEEPADESE